MNLGTAQKGNVVVKKIIKLTWKKKWDHKLDNLFLIQQLELLTHCIPLYDPRIYNIYQWSQNWSVQYWLL